MEPYREPTPLAAIIPPDRRRAKAAALVVASMVTGAALLALGQMVVGMMASPAPPPNPPPMSVIVGGKIEPVELRGPELTMTVPPGKPAIVHVWLQGCADCMPAFEAMRKVQETGGFGGAAPEINVAYGQADPSWAALYGVRTNLLFDRGGAAVVKPLQISSFTTLVMRADGTVTHRDRPDRLGYRERVLAALSVEQASQAARDAKAAAVAVPPKKLDAESVSAVVRQRQSALRKACWKSEKPESASLAVSVVIRADGSVASVSAHRDEVGTRYEPDWRDAPPALAACVEQQIRSWTFPRGDDEVTINIPLRFVTQ